MRRARCVAWLTSLLTSNMRTYSYCDTLGSPRAMAKILDGKGLAERMNKELREQILAWTAQGRRAPTLRCLIVGTDPASETYVRNKIKAAGTVGILAETIQLNDTISEKELLAKIHELNKDARVDGILVQLPLPAGMDERRVCNAVSPRKDVDGFHVTNVGQMCLDEPSIVPATPLGVIELIKRSNIETFGRDAVVIGRSKNVGMPMAMLLHADGKHGSRLGLDASVTVCHRYTPPDRLRFYCQNADIIISATGVPGLITADMVKPGATVIDVGITRITTPEGKTKLVGDVDFDRVREVAGAITPVPGGVGPMTVAMLMRNTFAAACMSPS